MKKRIVWQYKHLNLGKGCIVIKTFEYRETWRVAAQISELWKNVLLQYKHLNLGTVLCGNSNI